MDDLNKGVFQVWELRLRLERSWKRIKRLEAILQSDEYQSSHSKKEQQETRKEIMEIKKEQFALEEIQIQMEEKIQLPNPYLNKD